MRLIRAASCVLACLFSMAGDCQPPPPNPDPNPNPPPPDSGVEVADPVQLAVMKSVDQFLADLNEPDEAAANEQIAAHLRGLAGVAKAGTDPSGTVWAHFADGQMIAIFNNRDPDPYDLEEPHPDDVSAGGRPKIKDAPDKLIPHHRVQIINGMPPMNHTIVPSIQRIFTSYGYQLSENGSRPTVEDWHALQPCGVYFLHGHGGIINTTSGEEEFILTTNMPVNLSSELLLKQDLIHGRVLATRDDETAYWHYSITRAFIQEYQPFLSDSLLILSACNGNRPGAVRFRDT